MENDRYEVMNDLTSQSHGFYDTMDEARGAGPVELNHSVLCF